jgi:hypothetical protein
MKEMQYVDYVRILTQTKLKKKSILKIWIWIEYDAFNELVLIFRCDNVL